MKKVVICIFIAFVIFTIGVFSGIFIYDLNQYNKEVLYLKYDDLFPIDNIYSYEGKNSNNLFSEDKYKLIFYISDKCKTCIDDIEYLDRIINFYKSNKIEILIIWQNEIPINIIEKYQWNIDNNLYSKDISLSSSFPHYFILDENNKVILSNNNLDNIVTKINDLNIIDKDTLKFNTNLYIKNKLIQQYEKTKPILIYFSMEGCKDCEISDETIFSEEIQQNFIVETIYSYNLNSTKKNLDKYKLFLKSYSIDWYPSFLILDINTNDYTFLGKLSSEKNLKEEILNLLKK